MSRTKNASMERWLFADQLGPHFTDDHDGRFVLIESLSSLGRRPIHRQKAHLLLSALRHRVHELGDRASLLQSDTYSEVIRQRPQVPEVITPTSWGARRLVTELGCTTHPSRGFVLSEDEFAQWCGKRGSRRLVQEDFYRHVRRHTGILMDGDQPTGGQWNFDADNRQPPPKGQATLGVVDPWWPTEDEVDESVRLDLDRWAAQGRIALIGQDAPRAFAVTRSEALEALSWFIDHRLSTFGAFEDAAMADDWTMSHSLLSVPLNLGLLHPHECAEAAELAYREGRVPLASAEGFIRQVVGWRDFVWHAHWAFGDTYATANNSLEAHEPLPAWFANLDHESVKARCLSTALREVGQHGWNHHIVRLMVLGNWALQRGYDPVELFEWFRTRYVDGFEWVMSANVIGMATYADGGRMSTKPYAAGGAYINRMTNYCRGCVYRPDVRVGENACPFTAGYWWFMQRNRPALAGNHRVAPVLRGMDRLSDLDALVEQESARGEGPP